MPRKRRRESSTMFYHVIVKGINNEDIYRQQREKIYFKKKILKYLKKYDVELYAYCIMSNHAHLIIKAQLPVLSAFMAVVLAEYAVYYNYKHHRNGHVFQNRFVSECIETERIFLELSAVCSFEPGQGKNGKRACTLQVQQPCGI